MVLVGFDVSVELLFITYKFKILGFMHLSKDRPIGNIRYLSLSDLNIIRNFSYIYFMIMFWFLDCNNYKKLRSFLSLLRQSCILTLARKHNKSKSWASAIFTSNFLITKGIFTNSPGLFSFDFCYHHDHNFFSANNFFFIDESFFLFF